MLFRSDGSFITIKGTKSQIESMTEESKPPVLGAPGNFDPRTTADKIAEKSRANENDVKTKAEEDAARAKALAAGDPNYQSALDRISAGNQEKENQGLLKQSSQKQARIQALESQRANVLKYAQELDKTNPKAARTYWENYKNFSDEIARLKGAE